MHVIVAHRQERCTAREVGGAHERASARDEDLAAGLLEQAPSRDLFTASDHPPLAQDDLDMVRERVAARERRLDEGPRPGRRREASIAPTAPGSGEALTSTERSDVATALLRRCDRSSSAIVNAKLATATSGIIQNMRGR